MKFYRVPICSRDDIVSRCDYFGLFDKKALFC